MTFSLPGPSDSNGSNAASLWSDPLLPALSNATQAAVPVDWAPLPGTETGAVDIADIPDVPDVLDIPDIPDIPHIADVLTAMAGGEPPLAVPVAPSAPLPLRTAPPPPAAPAAPAAPLTRGTAIARLQTGMATFGAIAQSSATLPAAVRAALCVPFFHMKALARLAGQFCAAPGWSQEEARLATQAVDRLRSNAQALRAWLNQGRDDDLIDCCRDLAAIEQLLGPADGASAHPGAERSRCVGLLMEALGTPDLTQLRATLASARKALGQYLAVVSAADRRLPGEGAVAAATIDAVRRSPSSTIPAMDVRDMHQRQAPGMSAPP